MSAAPERSFADPVSQRDIARHFGVSHVTVSLALRHSPRVSKSLSERIRDHASAVGYRRDPVLFALADYKNRKTAKAVRGAIAWINAWDQPAMARLHPGIDSFWRGASEAAREYGFRLEEFRLGSELTPQRLQQVLETRSIRGILLPPHPPAKGWPDFPWDDYAVVCFGRAGGGQRGHRILPSAPANMTLALQRMRNSGRERIGCLTGPTLLRHAGYCMSESLPAVRRDITGEFPLLDLAGVQEARAAATVHAWVRDHGLDAVLADDAAIARRLTGAGFLVPGKIGLATLARADEAGIDPEFADIGRVAIRMLEERMREMAAGAPLRLRQVAIEGRWVEGSSLPVSASTR